MIREPYPNLPKRSRRSNCVTARAACWDISFRLWTRPHEESLNRGLANKNWIDGKRTEKADLLPPSWPIWKNGHDFLHHLADPSRRGVGRSLDACAGSRVN